MQEKLVFFVHGLGGDPDATWGSFAELLKCDPDIRDTSVGYFSYPTSLFRLPFSRKAPSVQTLAGALQTIIENRYPRCHEITMVCHSLGGLIGKQYLIDQVEQGRPLRVKSLLLFAVPNNGAGLASIADSISWRHGQLRQLCRNSDVVRSIATTWQRRQMTGKVDVRYVVAGLDNVVDEHSARESWGNVTVEVIPDHNHRSVVKPAAANDLSYLILKNTLLNRAQAATDKPWSSIKAPGDDLLGTVFPSPPQQDVRVAVSALLRISDGDSYVLVRNLHRRESFAPIGGVYKCYTDGRIRLDSLDFRAQATDADMEGDVRGFVPHERLDEFITWFNEGHGRESAGECLQRELREETAEAGLKIESEKLTGLRFAHVRTIREGPEPISGESYLQYRVFDVYDLVVESAYGREVLRKIQAHANLGKKMIWATSQDIIRGRDRSGRVIGAHTPYLFGQRRYRSQDPAFIVG
jgi:hypothetical protein